MASWNHVCEDCGHEWESSKENQRCPSCGSDSTQITKLKGGSVTALSKMTELNSEPSALFFGTKIV